MRPSGAASRASFISLNWFSSRAGGGAASGRALARRWGEAGEVGSPEKAEPLLVFLGGGGRAGRWGAGDESRSLSEASEREAARRSFWETVLLASRDSLEPFLGGRLIGGESTFSPPFLRIFWRSAALSSSRLTWLGSGLGLGLGRGIGLELLEVDRAAAVQVELLEEPGQGLRARVRLGLGGLGLGLG